MPPLLYTPLPLPQVHSMAERTQQSMMSLRTLSTSVPPPSPLPFFSLRAPCLGFLYICNMFRMSFKNMLCCALMYLLLNQFLPAFHTRLAGLLVLAMFQPHLNQPT